MPSQIEQRVKNLRDELNRHNYLYYIQAKPQISDREYDRMMQELIDLETAHPELVTPDSPSQRIGGEPIEGFRTVEHAVRMMSIDNTYSEEELRAFDERVRKGLGNGNVEYVVEPKVDGVSMSLRYESGVLTLGATRGDGRRGDDVTQNIRTIKSIPLRLHDGRPIPRVLEVRGEVFMSNDEFQRLNKRLESEGIEPMKNPRNATAGTLKQLDPKIVAARRLCFVSHGLGQVDPVPVDNYWDWLQLLRHWRIPNAEHTRKCANIDEVIREVQEFAKVRGKLPYQTDGMVIKVNSFKQRNDLGTTSKAPKWVIAFKYPAEQVQTVLHDVTWQVGKGGTLTPVAELEPVFVAGTTVRRATLHNIDQVQRLDLRIGDTVVIEKAGEIIPQVVQVVEEKRPSHARRVEAPEVCPSCGKPVGREPGEVAIRCTNPKCPAQIRERLIWFAGRNQMDIEGLGERLIEELVDAGVLHTYADFFRLRPDQIANLRREVKHGDKTVMQRVGEKIADKVIKSAEEAKSRGLARVLAGLGIPHVGATISYALAQRSGSIDVLMEASEQELQRVISDYRTAGGRAERSTDSQDERGVEKLVAELYDSLHTLSSELVVRAYLAEKSHPHADTRGFLERHAGDLGLGSRIRGRRLDKLAECFPEVGSLLAADRPALLRCLQEEKVIARSIHDFLHSEEARRVIDELRSVGVDMSEKRAAVAPAAAGSPFAGKTVVITGSFTRFARKDLATRLQALGAKIADSVSRNTDLLLVGADPGSKLAKAEELGVQRWDEDKLANYLNNER